MGLNRVVPAPASTLMQTPSPSGSSSPPTPMLDMSSLIKTEPLTHLDAMMVHCRSENWAESYQDLSSWCSATSASSPATCLSPVTDETLASEIEFHGEIDFDLRKSEEIASIPLEEDCSFNLWGVASPQLSENSSPPPPVVADFRAEKPHSVLLKDCWWSESEHGKVVKELESSRPQTLSISSTSFYKNQLETSPTPVVKEEAIEAKENMNPDNVQLPLLADPAKRAELQRRNERVVNLSHPGANRKDKAADLIKILQDQIAAFNKKKYSSPAAISDLHNYSRAPVVSKNLGESRGGAQSCIPSQDSTPAVTTVNPDSIFHSDPFEGLFTVNDNHVNHPAISGPQIHEESALSNQIFSQILPSNQPNAAAAPALVLNVFQPNLSKPSTTGGGSGVISGSDFFSDAHKEIIMRATAKPQQVASQSQSHLQQSQTPIYSQPTFLPSNLITNSQYTDQDHTEAAMKREGGLTIKMPSNRSAELDLNLDAHLFGSGGITAGGNKIPATPEVLRRLVETPDPEFDLLSYLCDDKVNTPPVNLDNNPFVFPQPSTSHTSSSSSVQTLTTFAHHKPNVGIVKPLKHTSHKQDLANLPQSNNSSVLVEVKPQLLPAPLLSIEVKEEGTKVIEECESSCDIATSNQSDETKVTPRPLRTARKRKYSEDEFELSPSSSDENPKSSRRRRRTTSSKYESDEEFTLPVRKSRKRSITTITEGEEEEHDEVKSKRSRLPSSGRRGERSLSSSSEADRYRELRDRNNEASRKSRLTRKAREQELAKQAEVLTKENRILKVKVEEMENLVKKMRESLLQSMMKKSQSYSV